MAFYSGSHLEFMFSLCSLRLLFHKQRGISQVKPAPAAGFGELGQGDRMFPEG